MFSVWNLNQYLIKKNLLKPFKMNGKFCYKINIQFLYIKEVTMIIAFEGWVK